MNKSIHPYLTALLTSIKHKTAIATIDSQELLQKLQDKNIVVYFYPRDNTPGCTTEGQDFAKHYSEFQQRNTEIVGISRNSVASHISFKLKYAFPFELLADFDSVLCKKFNVLKTKTMLGITKESLQRTTFLFNKRGLLVNEWENVKVTGHVQSVLNMARGFAN